MAGRDFMSQSRADSSAVILNTAAVKYMGLKNPLGEVVYIGKRQFKVIGVVNDMVMQSPYAPAKQTVFYLSNGDFDDVLLRLNPNISTHEAVEKIAAVCKTYSPSVPFSYKFADTEYAKKFSTEERVGKLASFFAVLAIFISCLGLFGMATFTAEQRIKEIGVRKVLGASVLSLWGLLSKEFVTLVVIACIIGVPVADYFMRNWLQGYQYHAGISWWVYATTGAGALVITLLTVSYQSIKAALMNPVKSLKTE
jgi:ABC-type antimicrobial peptide transport system permease subunit